MLLTLAQASELLGQSRRQESRGRSSRGVLAEALALPTEERAELIGHLFESLDAPADEAFDTDA